MSARLPLVLVMTALLALPTAASAATKHGITPLTPKAGSSVPAGRGGCGGRGGNKRAGGKPSSPPRLPARRWLEHYATQFDTVEVNSTFYRLAKPAAVDGWVHHTPHDFVFAVKASQYLTHMKRL